MMSRRYLAGAFGAAWLSRTRISLPVLNTGILSPILYGLAGSWVARCARVAALDRERSEAAQFHPIAAGEGIRDGVQDRVHNVLDVPLIQMRVPLGDLQNQIGFDHGGSARSLNLRRFSKAGCQTARSPSRFRQRTTRKGSHNLVGLWPGRLARQSNSVASLWAS